MENACRLGEEQNRNSSTLQQLHQGADVYKLVLPQTPIFYNNCLSSLNLLFNVDCEAVSSDVHGLTEQSHTHENPPPKTQVYILVVGQQ